MTPVAATRKLPVWRNLGQALGIVVLVTAVEYLFRHYVLFWLPRIGSLRVNDMLSLAVAYALLIGGFGFVLRVDWREEWAGIRKQIGDLLMTWGYVGWIVAMVLSIRVLPMLDRLFWGNVGLPSFISPYRNSMVWLAGLALLLKIVSVIAINGLFIPVTEEFLWRGLVQPRLAHVVAAPIAIGVTGVLFSLKHVIVDASLSRFLTIVAFGLITGALAQRKSWHASAALHMFINTVSSITALVLGQI